MNKLLLTILFLLVGCANMVTPTGGKKDEKAPELIKTNLTKTNFHQKQIKMEFNENVQLENTVKNITIQPAHSTFFVENTTKTVKINFDSSLRENTTYVLNIANGIKDLNEGNSYSYSYIFSTGPTIDTNFIEYKIVNYPDFKDLKIGLSNRNVDSIQKLKFDYLYQITGENTKINGLGTLPFYTWIFTDTDNDNKPDEYAPVYYDTVLLNSLKTITMNKWIDYNNKKVYHYKSYTKIFRRISDDTTYDTKDIIYIDKDSSLFYHQNNDTFPNLDLSNELKNKIKNKFTAYKSNREFILFIDKCGIRNIKISDNIKFKEDENFITIFSKYRIDSLNLKVQLKNDSSIFFINKIKYEDLSKISTLKISKNENEKTIIMAIYQNNELLKMSKIDLKNDHLFYLTSGPYKIIFYKTESYQNTAFNLNKLERVNCQILIKEIILKPNWDEVLQLNFK